MFTSIKRIFKSGWQNFKRQANLSFASCLILTITISLISFLFLGRLILNSLLAEARQKADISVYFKEDCPEENMFALKDELAGIGAVGECELVSKEEALAKFVETHKNDTRLMESLSEVGANPFLASLNIKAAGVAGYENIVNFLQNEKFLNVIEKIDYHKRKPVIEKIFDITQFASRAGLAVAIIFIFTSILISYNTTRLTIFSQKDEISVMRLVGASNNFVRGPFLIQGVLCGFLSFFISLIIVGLSSYFLTPQMVAIFPELQLFNFFRYNLWQLALIQIGTGLLLGTLPGLVAIRKYLQV